MQRSLVFGPIIAASLLVAAAHQAHAQGTRFRADWLFLERDNDASSQTLIAGPDAFNSSADFDIESGYRLFLGFGTVDFDVEFQYSRMDDWQDQRGAVLLNELSFDSEFANGVVIAAPPANTLNFNSAIFTAAEYTDGMAIDELTEAELLDALSVAQYGVDTEYGDFEVTIKTTRQNWYRVGLGYRNIQFDEANKLLVLGTFGAYDADDGAFPGGMIGMNDPNDMLSHDALVAAGLTNTSGAAGGILHGDTLLLGSASTNYNDLNGLQITFDATLVDESIFLFDVFANLGLFHNQISSRLVESYTASRGGAPSVYQTVYSDSENDLAVAGQFGFRGAVKLTDHIKTYLGYEVLYIDGLALGPNQPRLTTFSTIPVSGDSSVLIHGGRLGVELVW